MLNKAPATKPPPFVVDMVISPPSPQVDDSETAGAALARLDARMSDNSEFGGYFGFGPPHYNVGGCVAINGHYLVLTCGLNRSIDKLQTTVVEVPPRPFTR